MAKPVQNKTTGVKPASADFQSRVFLRDGDSHQPQVGIRSQVLTNTTPKYVTDATLASVIDSSRSTVWRYVKQGILPRPIKIGGLTRFDLEHALLCIRVGKLVPAPIDDL